MIKEYEVLGNYGQGLEVLYTAVTREEAYSVLKDYKLNDKEVTGLRVKIIYLKDLKAGITAK